MKCMIVLCVVTLAVGIAIGVIGNRALIAQQPPVTRTILQQQE